MVPSVKWIVIEPVSLPVVSPEEAARTAISPKDAGVVRVSVAVGDPGVISKTLFAVKDWYVNVVFGLKALVKVVGRPGDCWVLLVSRALFWNQSFKPKPPGLLKSVVTVGEGDPFASKTTSWLYPLAAIDVSGAVVLETAVIVPVEGVVPSPQSMVAL